MRKYSVQFNFIYIACVTKTDKYLAVTQSINPNKQEQQGKICFYQEGTFSRTVLVLFEDFIAKEAFLILLHLKTVVDISS